MDVNPSTPIHESSADSKRTIADIFTMFERRGSDAYIGEAVSQLEHALQSATSAERAGAGGALITAALLHDVGHLLHALPEDCADHGVDDRHEELGARWLISRFAPDVVEPIRLHVAAKRYLCATDPTYHAALSPASKQSLQLQGGPYTATEVAAFRAGAFAESAVCLRRWDDAAKTPGLPTPPLEHFRQHIETALRS